MHKSTHREEAGTLPPSLYSIFRGEVASLQNYGAFVRIPGCRKNGLVHKTQISKVKIDNPSEVLEVGDRVYCKVISLGEAGDDKISLSMKVVNQDNGKDLDENLVITKQEDQRRKKGLPPVQNKIELGAILNTVCRKCGMKGHLTQDCFKLPGDKTYELVPELDLDSLAQPLVQGEKKEKMKKKKKEKHKKKRKKRRAGSEEGDSSNEDEAKRDKVKNEKRKQRERESSEDSSESSSEDEDGRIRKKQSREKKRMFDLKYEDEQRKERNVPHKHGRHSMMDSKECRDGRDKRRDHSNREYHDRKKDKHHHKDRTDRDKDYSNERKQRHSKEHRYEDSHHRGNRR